jgi:integrase
MKPWKVTGKTGKVSWQIFYRNPEGKGVGKRFKTKQEAEAYLGKVKASKVEGRYHDVFDRKRETKTTFNELADLYVENFSAQKCFKSSKDYIIRELRAEFGDNLLSQITYLKIETWRNRRKASPTKKGGRVRAHGSVNYDLAVLRHMLNKAIQWGLLENHPFRKGERLAYKLNNARTRFLSESEIEALLGECSTHLRPIVETALLTGMRREELLSLKWEQIRHGLIYAVGKGDKSRQIPISDRLAEVLKELRQKNHLKWEYVFCDAQGRRYREVNKALHGACRRAGIDNFRFHDLRHTFASHLVMQGAGLAAVQKLLGHADIKMTMRYSHLSQGHLQEAVALLDNLPGAKEKLNFPSDKQKVIANAL